MISALYTWTAGAPSLGCWSDRLPTGCGLFMAPAAPFQKPALGRDG